MAASRHIAASLILCGLLAGCGSGDRTLAEVDPNAVPLDPDFELVFNIVQRECVPCHTEAEDEEDEPQNAGRLETLLTVSGGVEPDLRTCADIVANDSLIVDQVIDKNVMPPGAWPRLTSEEKLIIERWFNNGAKASCP